MDKKMRKLEKKLQDIRAEISALAPKLARMQRTPRYDASYSEAKCHNWQVDLGKLQEREAEAIAEYNAFISSDGYRAAVDEQVARMTVIINDLNADALEAKNRLFELRNGAPGQILEGSDPLTLAGEVLVVREQLEAIGEALGLAKLAMRSIKQPPQIDAPRELSKGEAARYKEYLPEHF
jgi:hypothetical protein